MSTEIALTPEPPPTAPPPRAYAAWGQVMLAALLMLATLPGRTQGLGLITEPLLADLQLPRVDYAQINLWATLLGSAACLPMGWLIDRYGLRWTTVTVLALLSLTVWQISALTGCGIGLFILILLTRGLGQSALSVSSITAVGKSRGLRTNLAMGVFSVLLSIFFIIAFVVLGEVIRTRGWRVAWVSVSVGLGIIALLTALALREHTAPLPQAAAEPAAGTSLVRALRTPVFWVFAGATALFGLVSSGLGLFNEAVLAERGFDQKTFHTFLGYTTLFALVGQGASGWLALRHSLARLLAVSMGLYAVGLAGLPWIHAPWQLWLAAAVLGLAAGFITVIFFAVWGQAFGRAHLGRIQGAAQMLTVFASAVGPLVFAQVHARTGSYSPVLLALAPCVLLLAGVAWFTRLPHSPQENVL